MAKYSNSQGGFSWTPAPPSNIEPGQKITSSKINEIKNNIDNLDDDLETCWNEKASRFVIRYSTYRTDKNDTEYQTNRASERENNYNTLYGNRYAANRTTHYNYRYYNLYTTYCSVKCSTDYYDDKWGWGANHYCASYHSHLYSNHLGTVNVPHLSGNCGPYHSSLYSDKFATDKGSDRESVHSSRFVSDNSSLNTTVHDTEDLDN